MEDEQQEETQPIANTKEEEIAKEELHKEQEWKPIVIAFRDQELRDKIEDIRSNTLITSAAVWAFVLVETVVRAVHIGKFVYSYFAKLNITGGGI